MNDYSWPNYGFGVNPTRSTAYNVLFTVTRLPGESPSGNDAIRFDSIGAPAGSQVQPEANWATSLASGAPPQGGAWYVRWRFKINSPVQWKRARDGADSGTKWLIVGNLCNGAPYAPTRTMSILNGENGPNYDQVFSTLHHNVDGSLSPSGSRTPDLTPDVWHSIQLKLQTSSTSTSTDAFLAQYLDADNASESTPTIASTGAFTLKPDGWTTEAGCTESTLSWGASSWWEILNGYNASFTLADFELDDSFDPNWHQP